MSLNFPHRFVWLFIGIIMVYLLQSGCQPIPQPATSPTTVATEAGQKEDRTPTETQKESTSPNGEWIATTLYQKPESSNEYREVFTVTHQSGTPSYTIVDTWSPAGLGYTLPYPLYWSDDGERLYYANVSHPDTLTPLLEEDAQLLRPVAWPNAETLLLENPTGDRFELDITTTEITATP